MRFPYKLLSDILQLKPGAMVEVKGHKIYLKTSDKASISFFLTGKYEEFETELLEREIREGMTFLDIGAYIGYYTVVASKVAGKEGKVFAFEPDLHNFRLLERNVETNACQNVVLVQKAVSDKSGKINLFLCNDSEGDRRAASRIYDSGNGRKHILVDAIALDDFFKEEDLEVHFIKMDIEGAEPLALKGMISLLARSKKVRMITEFYPEGLRLLGFSPEEYLRDLLECGFEIYHMNDQKKKLEPVNLQMPRRIYCVSLFCKKGSRERQVGTYAH